MESVRNQRCGTVSPEVNPSDIVVVNEYNLCIYSKLYNLHFFESLKKFSKYIVTDTFYILVCHVLLLLPPANEVCEGYVFTGVCLSTGCVWQGGVHGGGACMAGGMYGRGCVAGGMHGRGWWACMVGSCMAEGMHGGRSVAGVVCMAGGRHVWHAPVPGRYYEIWSMSGRYASYCNCILVI